MTPASDRAGLLRAMPVVFVLIWSTGFIVARYAMPNAPALTFLCWRYVGSISCFFIWIVWGRVPWPQSRSQWGHLAVTGVLMHAIYLGGVWAAVKAGMGSGLAALIVGLQPVLTAAWLTAQGDTLGRRQWLGLVLGFAGLALVVSRKLGQGVEASAGNLVLTLSALAAITVGTLYQKRFVQPCDVRSANAVQLMAALLVTLPFAMMEPGVVGWIQPDGVWNLPLMGALAWSVLVLTLGGSSLLYMLIQRGAATSVTSLLYLVPPCTATLAWLLFDEPITVTTVTGMALAALGVRLVVQTPRLAGR